MSYTALAVLTGLLVFLCLALWSYGRDQRDAARDAFAGWRRAIDDHQETIDAWRATLEPDEEDR